MAKLLSLMALGCILSPMLFGLFINDLAHHINKLDVGLPCEVFLLAMLMFAGDIALIAENECKLQCLLDVPMNGVTNGRCK